MTEPELIEVLGAHAEARGEQVKVLLAELRGAAADLECRDPRDLLASRLRRIIAEHSGGL